MRVGDHLRSANLHLECTNSHHSLLDPLKSRGSTQIDVCIEASHRFLKLTLVQTSKGPCPRFDSYISDDAWYVWLRILPTSMLSSQVYSNSNADLNISHYIRLLLQVSIPNNARE